jgi:hypothetical protein
MYMTINETSAVENPTTMQIAKFPNDKKPRLGMIKGTKINEVIVDATKAIIETKTMKAMYAL